MIERSPVIRAGAPGQGNTVSKVRFSLDHMGRRWASNPPLNIYICIDTRNRQKQENRCCLPYASSKQGRNKNLKNKRPRSGHMRLGLV